MRKVLEATDNNLRRELIGASRAARWREESCSASKGPSVPIQLPVSRRARKSGGLHTLSSPIARSVAHVVDKLRSELTSLAAMICANSSGGKSRNRVSNLSDSILESARTAGAGLYQNICGDWRSGKLVGRKAEVLVAKCIFDFTSEISRDRHDSH